MLRVGRMDDALRCFQRAAALGDRSVATQVNLVLDKALMHWDQANGDLRLLRCFASWTSLLKKDSNE